MISQKTFHDDNAKLYLVSTPIGNLEDITFRAIAVLKKVDFIYCEDTRTSMKLLKHYDINTPLRSFHLFNENEIAEQLLDVLKKGQSVAIISDAGMPVISDPGYIAVKRAIEEGVDIVVVPGASAGISALIASGISPYRFLFVGFLNSKKTKRKKELENLKNVKETIIMYESPHRIVETLKLIDEIFKDRKIVLARELTKIHEEYLRATASEILESDVNLKGEMVLIIEGDVTKNDDELSDLSIEKHYQYYLDQGYESKVALKNVSVDRSITKRQVYDVLFKKEKKDD